MKPSISPPVMLPASPPRAAPFAPPSLNSAIDPIARLLAMSKPGGPGIPRPPPNQPDPNPIPGVPTGYFTNLAFQLAGPPPPPLNPPVNPLPGNPGGPMPMPSPFPPLPPAIPSPGVPGIPGPGTPFEPLLPKLSVPHYLGGGMRTAYPRMVR